MEVLLEKWDVWLEGGICFGWDLMDDVLLLRRFMLDVWWWIRADVLGFWTLRVDNLEEILFNLVFKWDKEEWIWFSKEENVFSSWEVKYDCKLFNNGVMLLLFLGLISNLGCCLWECFCLIIGANSFLIWLLFKGCVLSISWMGLFMYAFCFWFWCNEIFECWDGDFCIELLFLLLLIIKKFCSSGGCEIPSSSALIFCSSSKRIFEEDLFLFNNTFWLECWLGLREGCSLLIDCSSSFSSSSGMMSCGCDFCSSNTCSLFSSSCWDWCLLFELCKLISSYSLLINWCSFSENSFAFNLAFSLSSSLSMSSSLNSSSLCDSCSSMFSLSGGLLSLALLSFLLEWCSFISSLLKYLSSQACTHG